jgi:hypothetical protein
MPIRQPVGIKVWGAILILIGGFSSLVTVLEIIDSIRFYGPESLLIVSLASLMGFLVYGVMPILFYSVGVALFMSRFWAWRSVLTGVPLLFFLFCIIQAVHVCKIISPAWHFTTVDYFFRYPDVFIKFLVLFFIFAGPLVLYFRQSGIRDYFLLQKPD